MKRIIAYKDYFAKFVSGLSSPEQGKIQRALLLLGQDDRIPYHYIKYIRDGVYEFRINYGKSEFRIFFAYGKNDVVVLLNCLKKKTQKLPKYEIDKAVKLKVEYYETGTNP